jgi:Cu-Zn family superoxide dismutase
MKTTLTTFAAALGLATAGLACADYTVAVSSIDAQGVKTALGNVKVTAADKGVKFTPDLKGLPPGDHGFHVHQNPSCDPAPKDGKPEAGEAAGGHFDPASTGTHAGPKGKGHVGDLPTLVVNSKGEARKAVTAPRLTLAQLKDHSLMIHAGGDNKTDTPANGGGGTRIACGIIQ